MSKVIARTLKLYPEQFSQIPNNKLWCSYCNRIITHKKFHFVQSHWATTQHQNLIKHPLVFKQSFLHSIKKETQYMIVDAFSSANIPLAKLRHPKIIQFFNYHGTAAPSETTARRYLNNI